MSLCVRSFRLHMFMSQRLILVTDIRDSGHGWSHKLPHLLEEKATVRIDAAYGGAHPARNHEVIVVRSRNVMALTI